MNNVSSPPPPKIEKKKKKRIVNKQLKIKIVNEKKATSFENKY